MEENSKNSKLKIIIAAIVLVIIIVTLIVAIVTNNQKNKEISKENSITNVQGNTLNAASESDEMLNTETLTTNTNNKEDLSQDEINYFTEYFTKTENNAFIKSTYSDVENIDLNVALYNGIDDTEVELATDEKQALETKLGYDINTDVVKLTTTQIKDFFEEKTGENIENIASKLTNFIYLSQYDAYYSVHGDTNFVNIKCVSGQKTSDGKYVISYKKVDESIDTNFSEGTITLQKQNNKYLVVSNTLIK